jgi:hypothetical protein
MQRKDEGTVSLGGTVEYQYTITNPTDVPLDVVELHDNQLGLLVPDEFEPFTLEAGRSDTLFQKATLLEDTINTAEVVVVGERGQQCEATDLVPVTVLPPPPPPFDCSEAKPLNGLTMVWDGTDTVDVVAHNGDRSKPVVGSRDGLEPGKEVSFSGFSTNDIFWEIFDATTGQKLGESAFHLSCSDPNMNGSEDCGLPQGDGKDKSDVLNDWLLEGIQGEGGVLDCTSDEATRERRDVPGSAVCGLGFELAFLLPPLLWLQRRRRQKAC